MCAATPELNVGPFGLNEAWWVAIGAAVSTIVAIVTGGMAVFTRMLAIETKSLATETRDLVKSSSDERTQIERHHVQSFQPHIAVYVEQDLSSGSTFVMLKNIGPGLAQDIEMSGTLGQGQGIAVLNVPPALGAGQSCRYIRFNSGTNYVVWEGFELSYKDAFGNKFITTTGPNSTAFGHASPYKYYEVAAEVPGDQARGGDSA